MPGTAKDLADPPAAEQLAECDPERFLALYEPLRERFFATISAACESEEEDWPCRVWSALESAADFLAAEPDSARLLLLAPSGLGAPAAGPHADSLHRLASLLQHGRECYPEAVEPPSGTEAVLVAGIAALLAERLAADGLDDPENWIPGLVEVIVTPYIPGGAKAARAAVTAERRRRAAEQLLRQSPRTRERLPSGRHALPPERVTASQRRRLFASLAQALLEPGYSQTNVAGLVSRAGISKTTFYQLFEDRRACLLAAYDAAQDQLRSRVAEATAAESEWPARLRATVQATLALLAAQPELVYLLGFEGCVSDSVIAARYRETIESLRAQLRLGRRVRTEAYELPDGVEAALIATATTLIRAAAYEGHPQTTLPRLQSRIVEFLLAPYIGSAEAQRVASGAA